jgi:hypothetical protein
MKTMQERIEAAIKLANELAQSEGLQTVGYQEYWYRFSAAAWGKKDEEVSRLYLNLKYGRSNKWSRGTSLYIDLNNFSVGEGRGGYCNADERDRMESIANRVADYLIESEEV